MLGPKKTQVGKAIALIQYHNNGPQSKVQDKTNNTEANYNTSGNANPSITDLLYLQGHLSTVTRFHCFPSISPPPSSETGLLQQLCVDRTHLKRILNASKIPRVL